MSEGVFTWWCLLCAIGTFNVIAWAFAAATLRRNKAVMSSESYRACQCQLALSAIYVFGCAFRSVLPVFDIPRLSLFDVWFSSAFIGRTVATAAELAFVAQWVLMLRQTAAGWQSANRACLADHSAADRSGRDLLLVFGAHHVQSRPRHRRVVVGLVGTAGGNRDGRFSPALSRPLASRAADRRARRCALHRLHVLDRRPGGEQGARRPARHRGPKISGQCSVPVECYAVSISSMTRS